MMLFLEKFKVYKGHKSTILSLSVSANGQWLLSGSEDKTVKLWEISSGKCLKSLNFKEKISYVSWIPVKTLNLAAILRYGRYFNLLLVY